ncbi:MAG: M24 family metallopeptidase [Candidatus Bathyarchaeota archaeon]
MFSGMVKHLSARRINALKNMMEKLKFDCYVCKFSPNIQYLLANSQVDGEGFALIVFLDDKLPILYIPKLEETRVKFEVKNADIRLLTRTRFEENLLETFLEKKVKNVYFDSLSLTELEFFKKRLKNAYFKLFPSILINLREIKDELEVKLIEKATQISAMGVKVGLEFLRVGVKEFEVAAEIEYEMRKKGAESLAFKTIVASGFRSSFPHAVSTEKKIKSGDPVVIDVGAKFMGYVSDITRTSYVGKPSTTYQKIYDIVVSAQFKAIKAIKAGLKGFEADNIARNVIVDGGYGEYFPHGLGHGLGLEIHESPRLSATSEDVLKNMQVVTVEPGIYLPYKFGVRIEDVCLVTNKGLKVISKKYIQL